MKKMFGLVLILSFSLITIPGQDLDGHCILEGFPGICEYTEAYDELVYIFNNYDDVCEPVSELCITDVPETKVLTFDGKELSETTFPERILVVMYDGINKMIFYLERRYQQIIENAV